MYVDKSVFESENDKKQAALHAKKHHYNKEEHYISKGKVQKSELHVDKDIIQEKTFI